MKALFDLVEGEKQNLFCPIFVFFMKVIILLFKMNKNAFSFFPRLKFALSKLISVKIYREL